MSLKCSFLSPRRIYVTCMVVCGMTAMAAPAASQNFAEQTNIDPRLIEITQIVKMRALNPVTKAERAEAISQDDIYLSLVEQMQTSFYSHEADRIAKAVENFQKNYAGDGAVELTRIPQLYSTYTNLLASNSPASDIQLAISDFTNDGSWFENYCALSVAAHLHANARERQAALQKAQLALSLIPTNPNPQNEVYIIYARAQVVSLIAQLHNLQGNSELALATTLDYLQLTKSNFDLKDDVDLINNLIFSYSMARDQEAQLYLSEQLLEIEKTQSSNVPGLSQLRISGVMNSSGRFVEGLNYAEQSLETVEHPTVLRLGQLSKSIALAGLGRFEEARAMAKTAQVNLDPKYLLEEETRTADLYLAFLLAQAEDTAYATQLYNRQLDVIAQKFLSNNSRDTTAMLAELENSRERQAEREAAQVRESELQAMTIARQRNLNRALMAVMLLMSLAILFAALFIRYRSRVMRKLEIKTREAASAEKLKTEFLGMISHELRTPLNGIIGISDYLANYHADADIRQKTGIVLQSGNELLAVVESLTDMARIDAGQLTLLPHDANLGASLATVPEKWKEKAAEKNLVFTHFIDPDISAHYVDEDRILQCIDTLLANAISFTDTGRVHLHITASKTEPAEMHIIVADTGRGMSELVQSRLFTPFMQADTSRKRNHMGTGLNLAIAYALAEMMEGSLSCISRDGRGSEFKLVIPLRPAGPDFSAQSFVREDASLPASLSLPVEQETPKRPEPVLNTPEAPQRDYVDLMQPSAFGRPGLHQTKVDLSEEIPSKRILIVDDIESNRDVLRLILETNGHICSEAGDGYAALAKLDQQGFDLVILDIHMTPMDGVEALRRIRSSQKAYANIPVIALTADNAPNTNAESIKAGANLFLEKPVKLNELLDALDYLEHDNSVRILSQNR